MVMVGSVSILLTLGCSNWPTKFLLTTLTGMYADNMFVGWLFVLHVCILVSLFVGIYIWLNWTTLLFISKFLSSINQSVHPLMIYYHFPPHHSSHHHSISSIPSPSSLFSHPLITHHHIHPSHSLCWFIWQRGSYAKYNPDLKLGYECCSTDSISFHYLKVVRTYC